MVLRTECNEAMGVYNPYSMYRVRAQPSMPRQKHRTEGPRTNRRTEPWLCQGPSARSRQACQGVAWKCRSVASSERRDLPSIWCWSFLWLLAVTCQDLRSPQLLLQAFAWSAFNPLPPLACGYRYASFAGPAQSWPGQLLRAALHSPVCVTSRQDEAYRLVNGEGDGLSGLIVNHLTLLLQGNKQDKW